MSDKSELDYGVTDGDICASVSPDQPLVREERNKKMEANTQVFAFECGIRGYDYATVVNHFTRGRARAQFFRGLEWDGLGYTDITCRKVGAVRNTGGFAHTAKYRGVDFNCGDTVYVNGSVGVVVGSNSSANFNVLFTSGKHKGHTLNCHPSEIKTEAPDED